MDPRFRAKGCTLLADLRRSGWEKSARNENLFAPHPRKACPRLRGDRLFGGKVDKGRVALTNHRIISATFEPGYVLKCDALRRSIDVVPVCGF